ncbi:polysaccharide pyruvyl transferase family protein [Oceanobacillus halophilus]|uniref:polysaccharide pyruvyl transferase family protein n=1 Tax=Oceanobacillus halophilus TaxID=930130 RepID=UPI0013144F74|nr:polysaccharide pyruvyl transferase family protein [Oceanobacillus halophilus]
MKKILVCAYFAKNLGDDLFLKILFDRYPNVEWDLLTANRNYKRIFENYRNVKITYLYRGLNFRNHNYNPFYLLNDLFLSYKKYDAFINIGGSIFMQSPAWKLKLSEREYLLRKFKKLGKKAFVLGANFGPYKDEQFIEEYKELFYEYDDICFRDTYSYTIFKDLDNVRLAPDIAFSLGSKVKRTNEKSIGFSIIDLEKLEGLKEYYEPYNDKVISLIEDYINQGYKIKLFSFCDNEGDLKVINFIKENINSNFSSDLQVFNYDGNIETFLREFKSCQIIIGTRFHSVILAMLNNQPFFPIIYNEKTYNLLVDLKMNKVCCHIKDIENLSVESVVEAIKNNTFNNSKVFLNADKQFEKLDVFLA